jgi:chromosome segregation ATPase
MRGEVFHPGGPVLVAQEGKSSTLSRSRQKRELGAELKEIQSRTELLSHWISENQVSLQALNQEKSKENAALQNLVKTEEISRRKFQEQSLKLEQARHQINWQSEQRELINERIKQEETQIAAFSEQLIEFQSIVSETQAELRVKRANLADLPLNDLQSEAAHWSMQAVIAEKALEEVQHRMVEQDQASIQATGLKPRRRANRRFKARLTLESEKMVSGRKARSMLN